jgi:hypothetical protein
VDYGIDISSWQGSSIDWNAVKGNNISFASVKVTEATGYVNPHATTQVDAARGVGIHTGGYHYAHPGNVAGQVAHFVAQLNARGLLGSGSLWPMLDMEHHTFTGDPNGFVAEFIREYRAQSGRRVAGLLVLLYAQRAARITELTTKHVTVTDDSVELLLADTPITLPPMLGDLVLELLADRQKSVATAPDHGVWLYPATRLGQPLAPRDLLGRLRALGISPTLGRNTALMQMASEMPAAVIAKMLGISLNRATRWTQDAGNTRPGYAAEVARRG